MNDRIAAVAKALAREIQPLLEAAYDEGWNQCHQGGYPSVTYGSNLNPYRAPRKRAKEQG